MRICSAFSTRQRSPSGRVPLVGSQRRGGGRHVADPQHGRLDQERIRLGWQRRRRQEREIRAAGVASRQGRHGGKHAPGADVAAAADPNTGALVILNQQGQQIGGTSWAAPTWAAIVALINQARTKAGKGALPFLNPLLYPQRLGQLPRRLARLERRVPRFVRARPGQWPRLAQREIAAQGIARKGVISRQ